MFKIIEFVLFPVTFSGMMRLARDFQDAYLDNTTDEYHDLEQEASGLIVSGSPYLMIS